MNRRKEIATFTCSVTAWEAIVHLSFACCHSLPMKLGGITLTKRLNTTQIIVPALTSSLLAYYAWASK